MSSATHQRLFCLSSPSLSAHNKLPMLANSIEYSSQILVHTCPEVVSAMIKAHEAVYVHRTPSGHLISD
jgi:hypothetical protein